MHHVLHPGLDKHQRVLAGWLGPGDLHDCHPGIRGAGLPLVLHYCIAPGMCWVTPQGHAALQFLAHRSCSRTLPHTPTHSWHILPHTTAAAGAAAAAVAARPAVLTVALLQRA